MIMKNKSRLSEEEWWELFSNIATIQWEITPRLNNIVRRAYLDEMQTYLFYPGGCLLDVGCGSGWVGIEIAKMGMSLTGVDTSFKQLRKAMEKAQLAGLRDTHFIVGTISQIETTQKFDSIFFLSMFTS